MSTKKIVDQLCLLPAGVVHIWSASLLDHRKDTDYLTSILSEDEQERAGNFKFSKDREYYIIARGILRCLLSSYLEQSPQSIEFVYELGGKPRLAGEPPLHFNVSHSGNYALYAFTRQYEVGIDIEYINKDLEIEDIVSIILSSDERTHWNSIPSKDKVQVFFRLWTCKEAYLKASGEGWLGDERKTSLKKTNFFKNNFVRLPPSSNAVIYPYHFEHPAGYSCALFVKGPALRIVHQLFYFIPFLLMN